MPQLLIVIAGVIMLSLTTAAYLLQIRTAPTATTPHISPGISVVESCGQLFVHAETPWKLIFECNNLHCTSQHVYIGEATGPKPTEIPRHSYHYTITSQSGLEWSQNASKRTEPTSLYAKTCATIK